MRRTIGQANRHWSKKPPVEWCRQVEQAGIDGLAVSDAAARLGISPTTFGYWERKHPEFGKSAQQVRENSARKALARTEKKLAMSEEKLLQALEHVRRKKAEESARIE